jgi:2-polyprenyl-6-methoxyphenol hydroxylase-like FAD-dependent oxidoreductase
MKALVVGAGVGGLTAALALSARGVEVEVFEAAPQPAVSGGGLGIASNATKVLSVLGLDLAKVGMGRICEQFCVRTAKGRHMREMPIKSIADELGSPVVNVSRQDLLGLLRGAMNGTPLHQGAKVTHYDPVGDGVSITCADGRTYSGDVLIGADGIRSVVRAQAVGPEPVHEYGYVCWIATAPFEHPRLPRGGAAHYWGRGQRFGLIDIGGGRAYWWGTKNTARSGRQLRQVGEKERVLRCFDGWADEVPQVISVTDQADIVSVPAQDRSFLEAWGAGPVTLVGDAAHPMLTSLSQGAGSAIEDGHALAHHLAAGPDVVTALRRYEAQRRARTRWLVSASRRLSRMEQRANPVTAGLRNFAIRRVPQSAVRRQLADPMRYELPA